MLKTLWSLYDEPQVKKNPDGHCTLNHQVEYVLEWTAPEHYVAGTKIEIRCDCLRSYIFWDCMNAEMESADVVWRCTPHPDISEIFNANRTFFRARLAQGARRGETREVRMLMIPSMFAGVDAELSVWVVDQKLRETEDDPEATLEADSTCVLPAKAGPVGRLRVISRPYPGAEGEVRTCVVPEDHCGNPTEFAREMNVALTWEGEQREISLKGTKILELPAPADVGRAEVAIPMSELGRRENIANGRREGGRLRVTGNPVWSGREDGLQPAFGEFHWHTEFSGDGDRPIKEAVRSAKDDINLDYLAPGDHTPTGEAWAKTVEAMDEAYEPGHFATFYGYEQSSPRGHVNAYFLDPDHRLKPGCEELQGYPEDYLADISGDDFMLIPHHTNALAETRDEEGIPYWHPFPWPEPMPCMPLAEIIQVRGNQERNEYTDEWHGWHQHNGASIQDALADGHEIGFTGGTDNHCGWPARAYAPSEIPQGADNEPHTQIMTGLWTPELTREQVFDQLQSRATWVVRDTRAIVHFTVNDVLMGGTVEIGEGEKVSAHIRLSAQDALQVVELVSEREVVWSDSSSDLDNVWSVNLGSPTRDTHFYLRALQRDGGLVYGSPVFVKVR